MNYCKPFPQGNTIDHSLEQNLHLAYCRFLMTEDILRLFQQEFRDL